MADDNFMTNCNGLCSVSSYSLATQVIYSKALLHFQKTCRTVLSPSSKFFATPARLGKNASDFRAKNSRNTFLTKPSGFCITFLRKQRRVPADSGLTRKRFRIRKSFFLLRIPFTSNSFVLWPAVGHICGKYR